MAPGGRQIQHTVGVAAEGPADAEGASILLALYQLGRELSGQGLGVAERLCQEVARLTRGRAHLIPRAFEDTTSSSVAVSRASMLLPVDHAGISYGNLEVARDAPPPMGLALPLTFCAELAATCGWMLHVLEETALIQTQSQHLTASDLGIIGKLSRCQRTVLLGMARGCTAEEIARRLGITPSTVDSHRKAIYQRLRVNSALDAVLLGHQRGLYLLIAERG